MKKLLSLLLCIVLVCLALVGCQQDVIGEYLPNYQTGAVTDDQIEKLNFYIITGEGTSPDAKITVPQNINSYLKEKYHIELNINYLTEHATESQEKSYADTVYDAMKTTVESERPDIILINSADMFDTLYLENQLLKLNTAPFDFYNEDYRTLNKIIDPSLLSASAVNGGYYTVPNNHVIGNYEYIVVDKEMVRDTLHFSEEEIMAMTTVSSLEPIYQHLGNYYDAKLSGSEISKEDFVNEYVQIVSGNYADKLLLEHNITESTETVNYVNILSATNQLIVINKAMATDTLGISAVEIAKITSAATLENFKTTLGNYYDTLENEELTKDAFISKYVEVRAMSNEDQILLPYGYTTQSIKSKLVNISSYPNTTKEQAFLSAFAIVRQLDDNGDPTKYSEEKVAILNKHYDKCMKIIYALNNDVELKNMLQYGYVGTNYTFVTNEKHENTNYITLNTNPTVRYEMNNIHTGNPYISYYCESISWNELIHNNCLRQNADAYEMRRLLEIEAGKLVLESSANNGTSIQLPTCAIDLAMVDISWSSQNSYVTVTNGTAVFNNNEETNVEAILKATLRYAGVTYEKTFTIQVKHA